MSEELHEELPQEAVADQEAPEQEAPAPEAETPKWSDEDAEEAKLFGWKSSEEWQGEKPDGYIDNPKEFLDRVSRSRIFKTMQDKLTKQEETLSRVNDAALRRQREQYEARMQEISRKQLQAVEEADTEAYKDLERQRQEMQQNAPDRQVQDTTPQIEAFKRENEWAQDPVFYAEAEQAVGIALQRGMVFKSADEQFAYAKRIVETKYPHLAKKQDPAPQRQQRVDGGGVGGGIARQPSAFSKLPQDAKAAFARFVKQGIYEDSPKGKEEYANDYL